MQLPKILKIFPFFNNQPTAGEDNVDNNVIFDEKSALLITLDKDKLEKLFFRYNLNPELISLHFTKLLVNNPSLFSYLVDNFLDSDIVNEVNKLFEEIQSNLYEKALHRRNKMTYTAKNMKELEKIITNNPGFVKAMWCGSKECEERIKEVRGTKSRCIPFEQEHISDKCVCCGKDAKEMVVWGIQY